jgi:hypothetical protein
MRESIIPEMCEGCARPRGQICTIIVEPEYFHGKYGYCFARVNPQQAHEIEQQIKEMELTRKQPRGEES